MTARRIILEAGAFDQEWYEAQTGVVFGSVERACWHYLWQGRRSGLSPHPLFEPSMAMPRTYRSVGIDPLVANLRGRPLRGARVHCAVPASWSDRDPHTKLPRWLTWAQAATADTTVPVVWAEPADVTWGDFRAAALAAARRCRRAEELRAAPVLTQDVPQYGPRPSARPAAAPAAPGHPVVSVVMPTWNRGGMLRRAVESVQAQTLTDWELIVVDDGSDDDTLLVLEGLARFEPRLQVVAAPHRGVCRARNLALDAARGRYVAFLDTDNVWTADFLRDAVDFASAEGLPWVHAAMQVESKSAGTRYRAFEGSREQLLHGNYIDLNVLVAERDVVARIGAFDESLRRAVDYDLILRLSEVSRPRLVPVVGAVYYDNAEDLDRISVAEPRAWNYFVSLKHLTDLDAARDRPRITGRVSIVVPVRERPQEVGDLVAELRRTAEPDVEIVVVVSGPGIPAARAIEVAAIGAANVTVIYRPTEFGWAASIDLGASRASGEYLVAWRANCFPRDGWWAGLRDALDQPDVGIAQALAVQPDGRIASAGAVFVAADPFPSPLLADFPIEDAAPLSMATIPSAYESVIALRSDTFWAVGGVDSILANEFGEVDLSLRVQNAGLGRCVVTNTAIVTGSLANRRGFTPDPSASVRILRLRHAAPTGSASVWRELQFEQTGRRVSTLVAGRGTPAEQGAAPVIRPLVTESPRRLRWALDVATSGAESGGWRFAQDLAVALRAAGQQVHVDTRKVRDSVHRDFDDVTLVLRGPDAVRPRPGGVSLMWILSDPESVTEPECAAYDRVFAASTIWSESTAKRWGLRVDPLLSCADATLFRPDLAAIAEAPEREAPGVDGDLRLVFAGDSGGILRPSVKCALDAGLRPQVYGQRWHGLLPDDLVAGTDVPADQLPAIFGSASAVLWDHWGDLRHEGFIAQRVFEILASGGRLLCDDVAGLRDRFGDAVAVFRSDHDLARLLSGDWSSRWPGVDERLALAERTRTEHSFAARAATLVDTALSLTRGGSGAGDALDFE